MHPQVLHDPKHVTFTGTRAGMTDAQKQAIFRIFTQALTWRPLMLHHGNCVGADHDMHQIARGLGLSIVIHPSTDSVQSASITHHQEAIGVHWPHPPLVRNRHMVYTSATLVATPREPYEIVRSGTWTTVRHARRVGIRTFIVWPNGHVTEREAIRA